MHIITLSQPCERTDGQALEAGEYIVEDLNAAEIMVVAERGTCTARLFNAVGEDRPADLKTFTGFAGATILVVHPGGFGDEIMLGPTLRALKRKYPDCAIHVCCRERSRVVFEGLDYPDGFISYPLALSDLREFDAVAFLENVNEVGEDARTKPAIDNKATRCGVELGDDRKVEWKISEIEAEFAKKYERKAPLRVGVQLAASAYNRSCPTELMFQVMGKLYAAGHEVFYFGTAGSTGKDPVPEKFRDRIHDCALDGLTFRQSAAVAATCDVMLTPDSALMHVAGALGIPCLALFGPIHWKTRTLDYPTVRAFQATSGCDMAPCFFHQRGGIWWPKGGACESGNRCEPLALIPPDEIVKRVLKLVPQLATP